MTDHLRRTCVPVALSICFAAACGGSKSPTSPGTSTPPPAPPPTTFTLSGTVTSSTTATGIGGATVRVADGPNAGRSTTTASSGSYSLTGLTLSGFTLNVSATNYVGTGVGVNLTSNQTVDVRLAPTPLFARTGVGDTVFDMPTTVSRIRITGTYTGSGSNFIVRIGGRLVVNEIIGTRWPSTTFEGTYVTTGGVTEITNSSGVNWSFTEVRQ